MSCRRLDGRSALITGAASGVGRATALRFAAEGARVLCLFDRDADNLAAVGAEVERLGAQPLLARGDVTDAGQCADAVQRTVAVAAPTPQRRSSISAWTSGSAYWRST
jgi:NAD(P)-dependent dehydrogenase (short-subunit alcohol dehydrogenase family)